MWVLFVSRYQKVFVIREATSPESYLEPDYTDTSLVSDSIDGRLDDLAEAVRIAKEEGWTRYNICFE